MNSEKTRRRAEQDTEKERLWAAAQRLADDLLVAIDSAFKLLDELRAVLSVDIGADVGDAMEAVSIAEMDLVGPFKTIAFWYDDDADAAELFDDDGTLA